MSTRVRILQQLADGDLHSGADIGRRLGVTRAAVSKGVKALCATGLVVNAVAGRGYRLSTPLTPLDRRRILELLGSSLQPPPRIEILEQVDSTNRHLLAQALLAREPSGMICFAEVQGQGRGRCGRSWVASAYQNLMMSAAWRFALGPGMVAGLSLAAGVAVLRALEAYGVTDIGLKWPNDILWVAPDASPRAALARPYRARERKLAGLLVDVHGEASGPCTAVLGVGVNCRIAERDAKRIDQPWTDLVSITGQTPDRNRLAALLIRHLYDMFRAFAASGFAAFESEWNRRHLYADRPVRIAQGDEFIEGIAGGVDASGALRLRTARGETQLFHSGDVSLRAAAS